MKNIGDYRIKQMITEQMSATSKQLQKINHITSGYDSYTLSLISGYKHLIQELSVLYTKIEEEEYAMEMSLKQSVNSLISIKDLQSIIIDEVNTLDKMTKPMVTYNSFTASKTKLEKEVFARMIFVVLATKYNIFDHHDDTMKYMNKNRTTWYNIQKKFDLSLEDNYKGTGDVIKAVIRRADEIVKKQK